MSDSLVPERMMPKLIVAAAFERGEDGELFPAYGPLAPKHAGVVAWSREANPAIDENGPPTMLFQAGEVLDIE